MSRLVAPHPSRNAVRSKHSKSQDDMTMPEAGQAASSRAEAGAWRSSACRSTSPTAAYAISLTWSPMTTMMVSEREQSGSAATSSSSVQLPDLSASGATTRCDSTCKTSCRLCCSIARSAIKSAEPTAPSSTAAASAGTSFSTRCCPSRTCSVIAFPGAMRAYRTRRRGRSVLSIGDSAAEIGSTLMLLWYTPCLAIASTAVGREQSLRPDQRSSPSASPLSKRGPAWLAPSVWA
mmetsp:Transcript_11147/g.26276  ORF Transcript_11147/g.26276 Transcript_11147/m.26276 type:complete len:235 (+) Transcript_11147:5301-6005(+)